MIDSIILIRIDTRLDTNDVFILYQVVHTLDIKVMVQNVEHAMNIICATMMEAASQSAQSMEI